MKSQGPVSRHVWASNGLQQAWGIQKCEGWDEDFGKRSYSETPGETPSSFMPQRLGHGCHTLMKYPFLSQNSSLQHAWLQTVLLLVDPWPEQGLWVTPTVSITCENTPVKIKLYKTQTNIKWGSCCGLSLCTAAHAFTYMVHVGRNPAWSLTAWPVPSLQTLRSTAGKSLMLHSNISFANFSCRIQLN